LHLFAHAPGFDAGGLTPAGAMRAACRTGRAGLGLPEGGYLAPGLPADVLVLDLEALDRDQLLPVAATELLFARATAAHIRDVWAKGRLVVQNGTVLGIDLPETESQLRAAYRDGLPATDLLRAAWPQIAASIADHYKGCC